MHSREKITEETSSFKSVTAFIKKCTVPVLFIFCFVTVRSYHCSACNELAFLIMLFVLPLPLLVLGNLYLISIEILDRILVLCCRIAEDGAGTI
jgi:hypothetical protein